MMWRMAEMSQESKITLLVTRPDRAPSAQAHLMTRMMRKPLTCPHPHLRMGPWRLTWGSLLADRDCSPAGLASVRLRSSPFASIRHCSPPGAPTDGLGAVWMEPAIWNLQRRHGGPLSLVPAVVARLNVTTYVTTYYSDSDQRQRTFCLP